ncbi:hypothetical protein D3C85_1850080 [compost metagenome]
MGNRFAERSRDLVRQMQAVGLQRLPGERRFREREQSAKIGVSLTVAELEQLQGLAQ